MTTPIPSGRPRSSRSLAVLARAVSIVGLALPALILVIAGTIKALDPPTAGVHLMDLLRLPTGWWAVPAGIALCCLEISVGLFAMVTIRRPNAMSILPVLTFYAVGLMVMGWARWTGEPPDCNCFGILQAYARKIEALGNGVLRNIIALVLLIGSLAGSLYLNYTGRGAPGPRWLAPIPRIGVRAPRTARAARGFTLLEVLAVVSVIALLLALLLPTLRGVRDAAKRASSVSRCRSLAASVLLMINDRNDLLPHPGEPDSNGQVPFPPGTSRANFFDYSSSWAALASADGYGLDPWQETTSSPFAEHPFGLNYDLACSLFSRPEYWRPETRIGQGQWKPVGHTELKFPGQKIMILDSPAYTQPVNGVAQLNGRVIAAFGDGGAATIPTWKTGMGTADGRVLGATHTIDVFPGLHTLHGAKGTDR